LLCFSQQKQNKIKNNETLNVCGPLCVLFCFERKEKRFEVKADAQ